ncbi:acetyl-CoA carboxylase biotin carboxyl carrier protein [Streptomyces ambofaciens]
MMSESRELQVVASPVVGTFHAAPPQPNASPFVAVGQSVREGDTLCIVEAQGLMNEIPAERAGVIAERLVDHGAPVEYGQPLFTIK